MSIKRQIQRNINKNNRDTLKQYDPFLQKGWENRSQSDINLFANLARNGITVADLNREIEQARRRAFEDTSVSVLKTVYACIVLVLSDEFGFDKDQCMKALSEIDHKMAFTIDSEEIIHEMEDRLGIRFNSSSGVERVEML